MAENLLKTFYHLFCLFRPLYVCLQEWATDVTYFNYKKIKGENLWKF